SVLMYNDVVQYANVAMKPSNRSGKASSKNSSVANTLSSTLGMIHRELSLSPLLSIVLGIIHHLRPVPLIYFRSENILDHLQLLDRKVASRRDVDNSDRRILGDVPRTSVGDQSRLH